MEGNGLETYKELYKDGALSKDEFEKLTGVDAASIIFEPTSIESTSINNSEVFRNEQTEKTNNYLPMEESNTLSEKEHTTEVSSGNKSTNAKTTPRLTIACYIFAAIMLIYCFSSIIDTTSQINEYYDTYNMSASFTEYIKYLFQGGATQLTSAITLFMAGKIYSKVDK